MANFMNNLVITIMHEKIEATIDAKQTRSARSDRAAPSLPFFDGTSREFKLGFPFAKLFSLETVCAASFLINSERRSFQITR